MPHLTDPTEGHSEEESSDLMGGDSSSGGLWDFLQNIDWGDTANLGAFLKLWEDQRGDLKDVGETAMTKAGEIGDAAAEATRFLPFTVTSGAGTVGADFSKGAATYYTDEDLAAGTIPEGSSVGDVKTKAGGLTLGLSEEQEALREWLEGQTGSFMQSYEDEYGTGDWRSKKEQSIFDRIMAAQEPGRERARLALESRLLGQGRLGTRTSMFGGTPEQLALSKAQEEQALQAWLAASTRASTEQGEDFGNIAKAMGLQYAPEQFLLSTLAPATNLASIADLGRRAGAGYQAESGMAGLDALLSSEVGRSNMTGQLLNALLTGPGGGTSGGLFGELFESAGGGLWDQIMKMFGGGGD